MAGAQPSSERATRRKIETFTDAVDVQGRSIPNEEVLQIPQGSLLDEHCRMQPDVRQDVVHVTALIERREFPPLAG
jgi:hypothetical protein